MRFKFIIYLLLAANTLQAQYYETGVEPFSVKWRQISTGKIRLIYPAESETIANKYLRMLSIADTIVGNDYAIGKSKLDIVLHNKTVLSNGFVAWAPRRMELVTHPAYNGFSQPWMYQLAIHETRHVKQMYALNRNLVKFGSYLFGQQATGLAAGFIPLWFLEGDAVATETAFSNSGRGRTASFYNHYRAHYLSNTKTFTYDKWLLGSYKDFIPNHYNLGYQIVSYGKLKYGDSVWSKTINHVTHKPFTIFPFYFGLKKETGLSRKRLAEKAFEYQDSVWTEDAKSYGAAKSSLISNATEEFANYQYPYLLNDSLAIAYKTSLKDIPSFVLINIRTKKESIINHPGYLLGRPYINDSLIIWSEYKSHKRWEYISYGQVVQYNFLSKTKTVFPQKGMFGSPILISKASVCCIEYRPEGYSQIVELEKSGKIRIKHAFTDNAEPFELAINPKNQKLYIAITTQKGKEILGINSDSTIQRVLGPTYMDINSIQVLGDSIYFSATNNFTENIYLHNIQNNSSYKILNSTYSSNYPNVNTRGSIIFSSYTKSGYKLQTKGSVSIISEIDINSITNDNFTRNLSKNAALNVDTLKISGTKYDSKPYKGIETLFNIHSWAPFYFNPYNSNPEESTLKLGATVMSQNLTGSTVLIMGYGYGESHLFRANLRYQGFWPVFSLSYELFDYSASIYSIRNAVYFPNKMRNRVKLYTYLPFTLSNSSFNSYLQVFNSIERTNDYLYEESISKYRSGLITVNNGVYFHALRRQAHRDLLPKYGIALTAIRVDAPYSRNNIGSINALTVNLYLPGVVDNHHIKLSGAKQKQALERYYMTNKVNPARGYSLYRSENYSGFSADYLFPLGYPDCSVGSFAYIKRFSLDLFYDYATNSFPVLSNNTISTYKETLQSVGFELNMDFHLFRTRYPFRLKYQQAFTGNDYQPYSNFSLLLDIYGGLGVREKYLEH